MSARAQYRVARRWLRSTPSLWNPQPQGITAEVWAAAYASRLDHRRARKHFPHDRRQRRGWRMVPEQYRRDKPYGCRCDSCAETSRYAKSGFPAWPCDAPKGKRKSAAEYSAHVAQLWEGVSRVRAVFKPGQAPIYPRDPAAVHPVTPAPGYVLDFIANGYAQRPDLWKQIDGRWEPVDISTQPKRRPYLLELARELRKAA